MKKKLILLIILLLLPLSVFAREERSSEIKFISYPRFNSVSSRHQLTVDHSILTNVLKTDSKSKSKKESKKSKKNNGIKIISLVISLAIGTIFLDKLDKDK